MDDTKQATTTLAWVALALSLLCAPLAAAQGAELYDWPQPWLSPGRTSTHGSSTAGTGDWIWADGMPAEDSGTAYFRGIGKSHDGTGLYVNLGTHASEYFAPGKDSGRSIVEKRQSGGLGSSIWSQSFPEKFVVGNPLVLAGKVYVAYNGYAATLSGTDAPKTQAGILVLDANNGTVLAEHLLHVDEVGQLTSSDGYLLFVTDSRTVIALTLPSLKQVWEWSSPITIHGPPAVDQGIVVVSQVDYDSAAGVLTKGMTAIELQAGKIKWTRVIDTGFGTPAILGPLVYVQGFSGLVSALSLDHGLLIWSVPAEQGGIPISVRDGLLVTGYTELEWNRSRAGNEQVQSYLRGWDPLTGKPLWTWNVPTTGQLVGGIALADNHLYFALDGEGVEAGFRVGCLDLKTLLPSWLVKPRHYGPIFLELEGPIMVDGRVFFTQMALDAGAEPVEGPRAAFKAAAAVPLNKDLAIRDESTPGTRPLADWSWKLVSEQDKQTYKDDWMILGAGRGFSGDQNPDLRAGFVQEPGNYTLLLRVWDDQGRLGYASQPLQVLPPVEYSPPPERGLPDPSALLAMAVLALVAFLRRRIR